MTCSETDATQALRPAEEISRPEPVSRSGVRFGRLALSLLDVTIACGRKVAGFCALLWLGWLYLRILGFGQTLHQIYPDAADPDLRQTLTVAFCLILAQGWDVPTDHIAEHWASVSTCLPQRPQGPLDRHRPLATVERFHRMLVASLSPSVTRLGRFMDLCVAIANKGGALAALGCLAFVAEQFGWAGITVREMYPTAADPVVSLLADLCVYVVVLSWWAMPFDQIRIFWHRLRAPRELLPRRATGCLNAPRPARPSSAASSAAEQRSD